MLLYFGGLRFTWRVGGLSKWVINRLITTITTLIGILIGAMTLITRSENYLLSPPTLQVGFRVSI